MKIENIIIDSLCISRASNVPVLFISNPGYGKTTILKKYADSNNMHLETLIGSRFSPEEISGYLVNNGGECLEHKSPDWFFRIWEKEKQGTPTLLFIDELSTCSESVQGSLLSLIFDRCIGSGKLLPESCVIVSAANYANNVSSYMNILSPTLNRFAIVNLNENYSPLDLLEEFLNEPEGNNSPKKILTPMSEEEKKTFYDNYEKFWKDTFIKYSDTESAIGILDINNQNVGGLYSDSERYLFNFISGRSISYLRKVLQAYFELGINNKDALNKLIDGLVGAGTCSFKEKKQADNYRKYLHKNLNALFSTPKKKKVKASGDGNTKLTGDISKDTANFIVNIESLESTPEQDLNYAMAITNEIKEKMDLKEILGNPASKFISDFEALLEFNQFISKFQESSTISKTVSKIAMDYYGLYCEILGIEKPDFISIFGITNPLFEKLCFVKKTGPKGKPVVARAALRRENESSLPSFYEVEAGTSFLEAKFTKRYLNSSDFKVLIYENGFTFLPISKYLERSKK